MSERYEKILFRAGIILLMLGVGSELIVNKSSSEQSKTVSSFKQISLQGEPNVEQAWRVKQFRIFFYDLAIDWSQVILCAGIILIYYHFCVMLIDGILSVSWTFSRHSNFNLSSLRTNRG